MTCVDSALLMHERPSVERSARCMVLGSQAAGVLHRLRGRADALRSSNECTRIMSERIRCLVIVLVLGATVAEFLGECAGAFVRGGAEFGES